MKSLVLSILFVITFLTANAQYDQKLVAVSSLQIGKEKISYIALSREGKRVKAKYFAARDESTGKTVYQRFLEWSKNKQMIAVSSGTYMENPEGNCDASDPRTKPVGLCIDNGITVNKSLKYNELDGLAVVYPSGGGGGIVLSNLNIGDLNINESGKNVSIDLRDGYSVTTKFMPWAESNKATVFQSHLFVWKNTFLLNPSKASTKIAKRRVLAVGTNPAGQVSHYIVDLPGAQSIYDAALKAFSFLQKRAQVKVDFMINLDTGCQDVFQVYKADGSIDPQFKGDTPLSNAANLLCYYYE